jgi:hypothetical protein
MIREPLVHFLLIGAALFLLFEWVGGARGDRRIEISRGQIDRLAESFEAVWLRPPTEAELQGLVDDYVRDEVAIREAVRMGLDRDDTVIRRRLREKLEFLLEDSLDTHPPSDEDLAFWLEKNADSFRTEEGTLPSLGEVRDEVERDLLAARRKAELDHAYERLLAEYEIVVEEASPRTP